MKKNVEQIHCHACGNLFTPRAKFCTDKCRMDAFIVRRAKKILKNKLATKKARD